MKNRAQASTLKKAVVFRLNESPVKGYLNPVGLGRAETVALLTSEGEHESIKLEDIKSIHFVRDFAEPAEPEQKIFLSRPKLDGLWVRLRFRDNDEMEGIVPNDLVDLLDSGVRLTPPDLHGNTVRMFIPRSALVEMKVLGVVGVARRAARAGGAPVGIQSKLFNE